MERPCIAALALILLAQSAAASENQPSWHVVVLPFTVAKGVDEKSGRLLDDVLLTELTAAVAPGIRVVGASDVAAVLGFEQQKQMASCDQTSCLVEIGNALGASHILVPSLGMFGKQFIISAKFIDVRDASVLWRKVIYTEATEEALLEGVRQSVRDLVRDRGWGNADPAAAAGAGGGPDPLLLVGGGVGGLGLLAAIGCGAGALYFDSQLGAADESWQQRDQAGQLEAGLLVGVGIGALALVTGGVLAGIALAGE
ncbi:MAG: hypothetical protein JXR83_12120 [Deltaproteobacteria bacterium]|nr:hypothetical protein [Deltaproteobacteria bacterium]